MRNGCTQLVCRSYFGLVNREMASRTVNDVATLCSKRKRHRDKDAPLVCTDIQGRLEGAYRRRLRRISRAACIKRIYEIDPLECPKCKAQIRIISFIQDEHSIKDIMKAQGIPDFQAPPPIHKFIDTSHSIDELPSYDAFEPAPDDF